MSLKSVITIFGHKGQQKQAVMFANVLASSWPGVAAAELGDNYLWIHHMQHLSHAIMWSIFNKKILILPALTNLLINLDSSQFSTGSWHWSLNSDGHIMAAFSLSLISGPCPVSLHTHLTKMLKTLCYGDSHTAVYVSTLLNVNHIWHQI